MRGDLCSSCAGRRFSGRPAFAAGPAGGAVAAAGGFARLFVADHAADQEADDERDHGDQRDVDEIGGEPREHKITSFRMRGSTVREEVLPAPRCH